MDRRRGETERQRPSSGSERIVLATEAARDETVKPRPQFSWDDLDSIRDEIVERENDPYPERSFTIADYALRYGIASNTALGQVRRLVKAGKLSEGSKRIVNSYGRSIMVRCFWLPPGGNENGRTLQVGKRRG